MVKSYPAPILSTNKIFNKQLDPDYAAIFCKLRVKPRNLQKKKPNTKIPKSPKHGEALIICPNTALMP
jgi:hypothetical protein